MEKKYQRPQRNDDKINRLIRKVEDELSDSIVPVSLTHLSAADRRIIHRHFDRSSEIVTKTYKIDEEEYELRVYPVGNLRRYAEKKADEAVQTGKVVVLPVMCSYERFVVHDTLKNNTSVKVASFGEDEERHIEIEPDLFGRGLKKIIKKIKLF